MKSEKLHFTAIRQNDEFASSVDYVLRTFARNSEFNHVCATSEEAPRLLEQTASPRVAIIYEEEGGAPDALGQITDKFDLAIVIQRSSFFGPEFLTSPHLPAPADLLLKAATPKGFAEFLTEFPKGYSLSLDVVAASFWFLARYEEYIEKTNSEDHGRFLCAHSAAPREMYKIPVVNRWFENLRALILNKLGMMHDPPAMERRHTIALTHDVDIMRKYRGLRGARRILSSMVQAPATEATVEMRMASLVMAGIRRDPYDSFDELFALKERIGAPSTFFFMGGGKHSHDGDYSLDDSHARGLLSQIKAAGDEIALHPSYESCKSQPTTVSEMAAVSSAAGRLVQGARQHYLRFAIPETWHILSASNLRYDSSMAFPDQTGFRCGWSGCFHPFDVNLKAELPIIEIPLILMDVSLAVYEKIPSEQALEHLAALIEASNVRHGAFVFLWHNIMRDKSSFPGYWDTFEYFFFAAAGSARFVTLSQLCDEFDATRE